MQEFEPIILFMQNNMQEGRQNKGVIKTFKNSKDNIDDILQKNEKPRKRKMG